MALAFLLWFTDSIHRSLRSLRSGHAHAPSALPPTVVPPALAGAVNVLSVNVLLSSLSVQLAPVNLSDLSPLFKEDLRNIPKTRAYCKPQSLLQSRIFPLTT